MNVATLLLLLFQSPTPSPVPVPHVPEKTPALFTLIYLIGFALVILLLLLSLVRNRRATAPTATVVSEDLPKEVRKRLGSHSTNRGLKFLRWLFVLLAIGLFSFHVYWATTPPKRTKNFSS